MHNLKKNYCLRKHNTFRINAKAKYFSVFESVSELKNILDSKIYKNNKTLILGGGSNILFTKDFNGLVLHNKIEGICIAEETDNFIIVEVGSGVAWHNFVKWSVLKGLSGVENLALIPGSVGASPVQNIGAYGMEVKNTITKVHTIDVAKGTARIFSNSECTFKYRESIFKTKLKNQFVITKVEFKLSKFALNKTNYGDIEQELQTLKMKPSPKNIAKAVINIRNRKLPNPSEIANSGSFFKNPIISKNKFESLKKDFPNIVGHKVSKYQTKLSAGWLIENAGLKGYQDGDAGVHKHQALVLVNYGNAKGENIINLAKKIQNIIFQRYKIQLEPEVNIL